MLKKNIDLSGRILRLICALILLFFAFWNSSWIALIFSLFVFFEVLMSWCVVYQLLGKNSCPLKSDQENKKK